MNILNSRRICNNINKKKLQDLNNWRVNVTRNYWNSKENANLSMKIS